MSRHAKRISSKPKRPKTKLGILISITASRRSWIAFAHSSQSVGIDMRSMSSYIGIAPSRACRSTRLWSPVTAFSSRIVSSRPERSTDDSLQYDGLHTRLPTLGCSVRSSPPASAG